MSDYTPTTEEVRTDYALYAWSDKFERSMRSDSFDRWLTEHDRQVKAEAWEEGQSSGYESGTAAALFGDYHIPESNPYREVSK